MSENKIRPFIPLIVFIGLCVLLGIGLGLNPREVPSPLINKPAPAFKLPQLHAPDQFLSEADMKGKVVMFNVWASWCAACRQEHGFLMELYKQNIIPIYGLNYKDEAEDAKRWLIQYGGNPYAASAHDLSGRVGIDWGVYGVPETFILDKRGMIRYKHIGPVHYQVWQETLLPIIQQLQAEPL
ncbi:MAG: DsbE family thiol:disulfide interchange protein [Gammaproteobacteria bacterium]|nr:DsbE family thiol:disulfide interchange protein [Gammaproteobacteria bacterium]